MSDSSLREALERIARGDVPLDTPASHFARDALAAHPAGSGAPVADRERVFQVVAEAIDDLDGVPQMGAAADHLERRSAHVADALFDAGVLSHPPAAPQVEGVRSEAEVKAEALREAAEQTPGLELGRRWLRKRADELESSSSAPEDTTELEGKR